MPPQMLNRGLSALLNTFQAARSFDGGCMVGPGVETRGQWPFRLASNRANESLQECNKKKVHGAVIVSA